MIIKLQRYNDFDDTLKYNQPIEIPDKLEFESAAKVRYQLSGIINHIGSTLLGGHYTG